VTIIHQMGGGLVTESDGPRIQKEYLYHNKHLHFSYLKVKDARNYDNERQMSIK
jgi:hypothetical protein